MRAAVFVIAHKVPRAAFYTLWHSAGAFLFAELTERRRPTPTNQSDADSAATNTESEG